MSYVEHGPRVFLTSRHNSGTPLIYGDYVLPKKRLEGRLKLHDSCSDIRAWSPNSLENSRYFRELSEHDSPVGKIIPFNVVIDNIIRLNSQAQTEFQAVKRELQKYKSLKLTPKQEEQLQNLDNTSKVKELTQKSNYATRLLRGAFLNVTKSGSMIESNSCLSIHIPCGNHLQSNVNNASAIRNQSSQLYSYSLTTLDVDPCLNNYNLVPSYRSTMKSLSAADDSEKTSSRVDVLVQVERETRDVEVQFDDQAISQTTFTSKSSDEDNSAIDLDKSSLRTNNNEDQSSECDASCSEDSQDSDSSSEFDTEIGTESDFNLHGGGHKRTIIQKDSEIIALKNDLCVRDAELEELRNMNKHLEILLKEKEDHIHSQQRNLKTLHEKLLNLNHQHNYEIEDLKQKLYGYKYLTDQLKEDLNEKCESCYVQSQEVDKLRSYVKEVTNLRLENDSLLKRLQDAEQLADKVENYDVALEQLKNVLQEKEELKKQNYEQNCILEDQEEKLNQLLKVIKEMSIAYNEQMEAKNMLEDLKAEIHDKNMKISHYEEQLASTKQEVSDFFNNLKYALNNLEELNEVCEDFCSCTKCDLDIGEEANNILYNINIIMTRFQSYKIESQNLLQQVGDLKHYIENDTRRAYINQNLRSIIHEDFYCYSLDPRDTIGKGNTNDTSETEFENIFNSVSNENLFCEITNNMDSYGLKKEYHNYILKLSRKDNMDEVEKEIIEYFARFLIKLRFLTQKLQIYVEIERPLMIKQMYYFYEVLRDTQSAINVSQDVALKKQLISDLYNQHKEEHKKYNSYVNQMPNDLLEVQNKINEFIEDILYQLLEEILNAEKKHLYDEKINKAFETHLRSCIDRINIALQGAGDQRIQIVETIEEQQKELKKKDIEIAQLKEVAQQLERRGEGDHLSEDKSEVNAMIKEQLSKVTIDLNKKDALISKLEEQLQIFKNELSVYNKDCNALRKENKNLENIKNRLLKESQQNKRQSIMKTKQIKDLSQQVQELYETKTLKTTLKDKVKEMEKRLIDLQLENKELESSIMQANMMISMKEQAITNLKSSIDKNDNILSQKVAEYENIVEEKHYEIVKLKDENKLLNDKVKDIECKLLRMNETIVSLTEQNDKINVIYAMQEDLTKLDKNEKKLRVELNNLRTQFVNDQNNNKKLDNNLEVFLRENEILKNNVEYWKNENSELSTRLCNGMIEEKLKSKLHALLNKISERLINLKTQSTLEKDSLSNEFIKKLQDKYMVNKLVFQMVQVVLSKRCQDHLIEIVNFLKIEVTADSVTRDLKPTCENQKREMKENEIEEIETQLLDSANIREEMLKSNYKKQLGSPEDNNLNMRFRIKHLEAENDKKQNETEKLLSDIEKRDCEIKHHKDVIKSLTQENADLRAVLKSQVKEYQDKLTLMKKNYDSSLNALCERHKANVEILQQQFEDNIKSERIFDSENWLLSLNVKELMELHERIGLIINNNSSIIHMDNKSRYLYDNNTQPQFYEKIGETEKKFQMLSANVYEKEPIPSKMVPTILKEEDSHIRNQWQSIVIGDTQKYPTLQTQNYKSSFEHSFGFLNSEVKSTELESKYEKEKLIEKDSTFDQQRWNFINQCSTFHKLSNIYYSTRSFSAD